MSQRILHGFHAIHGLLAATPAAIREIYLASGRQDARARALVEAAEAAGVRVLTVDRARIDGMTGHAPHQGVAATVTPQAAPRAVGIDELMENLSGTPLLLVLDGVQDPHNLGACLRTADAMGAHAVVIPKDRAAQLNATARKVASGAAETTPVVSVTNLARTLRELKEFGVWVVGLDGQAELPLAAASLAGPVALVMGAEGSGLRRITREACDALAKIPMVGAVESLNVSVASGMALYEARRQRG